VIKKNFTSIPRVAAAAKAKIFLPAIKNEKGFLWSRAHCYQSR